MYISPDVVVYTTACTVSCSPDIDFGDQNPTTNPSGGIQLPFIPG